MDGPLKAAILIVSTTAAQDPSTDASSDILKRVFQAQGENKWEVVETAFVSDDVTSIQLQIKSWADDGVNFIITTGGTGFALSDATPEVRIRNLFLRFSLIRYIGSDGITR